MPFTTVLSSTYIVGKIYSLSDTLQNSNDAITYQSTSTSYIELKRTRITGAPLALRIKFGLYTNSATYPAYGKIYRNSVAIGTERSTSSTTEVTFSEDFCYPWANNDACQVYAHPSQTGNRSYVANFRLYGTLVSDFDTSKVGSATPSFTNELS